MIGFFSDRFRDAGVRAVFSGHEHNFQHTIVDGINYFVSGGAGEIRTGTPSLEDFQAARTRAWGGNDEGHFLLVEIKGDGMDVTPVARLASDREPRKLTVKDVRGNRLDNYLPIQVRL
jgi:hypothetical protein